MLPASDKFKEIAERGHAKLAAIFQISLTSASAQLQTSFDWVAGVQEGTPDTDFPTTTTTEIVDPTETVMDVVDSSEFSWPDGRDVEIFGHPVAFLFLDNGVDPLEIASYDEIDFTTGAFKGMVRGIAGTSPVTLAIGDTITQLVFDPLLTAGNDLGVQRKGYSVPLATSGPPPERYGHTIVYDIGNDQLIIFAGLADDQSTILSDVWVYDLATRTWTEKTPAGGPSGRFFHSASWDTTRDIMVVTGGKDGIPFGTSDEVWEYDVNTGAQGTWTQVDDLPDGSLERHQSFYDPVTEIVFVFGRGSGDSKVYKYDHSQTPTNQWTTGPSMPFTVADYPRGEWLPIQGVFWIVASASTADVRTISYDPATDTFQTGFASGFAVISIVTGDDAFVVMTHDDVNRRIYAEYHTTSESNAFSKVYSVGANQWTEGVRPPDNTRRGNMSSAATWNVSAQEYIRWGGLDDGGSNKHFSDDDPTFFRWHWPSMEWQGPVMDLGIIPTVNGKITFSDFFPTTGNNVMEVSLEHADAPGGPFTSLGIVTNAQVLTDLKQFWRPSVDIQTDSIQSPSIQKIRISFDDLLNLCLCDNKLFDAEAIVMNIPALSVELDLLKAQSSISEMQIELNNADGRAKELIQKFRIYNRQATILIGFDEPGMTIDDFIPYNSGVVHKWKGDDKDSSKVTIIFRDPLQILEDTKVPPDENEAQPIPIVYVDGQVTHPVEIQRDLLENQINVPSQFLDLGSLATAASHPTLAGWKFLRTINDSEKGRDLLEQLSKLSASYIVPSEDGLLRAFVYDPSGEPIAELGRKDFVQGSLQFEFDDENLKNAAACYYGWDGTDEKAANFVEAIVSFDADSENAFNKTALERILPLWLGVAGAPYEGKIRATDIATRFTDQFANGLPIITGKTSLRWLQLQIGDLVRIIDDPDDPDWTIPYLMFGVDKVKDFKFVVVKKTVEYSSGEIDFTLWRAYEDLIIDIDSALDFQQAIL